jgi:hypothetical protein
LYGRTSATASSKRSERRGDVAVIHEPGASDASLARSSLGTATLKRTYWLSCSDDTNSIGNVKRSSAGAAPSTMRRTPAAVLMPDQVKVTRSPLSRESKSTWASPTSRDWTVTVRLDWSTATSSADQV